MAKRQDYFGRAVGNLSRSLRAIKRYEQAFEPDPIQQSEINKATRAAERAMEHLEAANRAARETERAAIAG